MTSTGPTEAFRAARAALLENADDLDAARAAFAWPELDRWNWATDWFDVLAANDLATALSPALQVGRNRLRTMFLDPADRALYQDWDTATAGLVSAFRESVDTDTDDPRVVPLVGELSLAIERFRTLWARHDVLSRQGGPTRFRHPLLGELTLHREKLAQLANLL